MTVRLRYDRTVDNLAEQLKEVGEPSTVTELDLTNCLRLDRVRLFPLIEQLTSLQSLRCLSSTLQPRDLVRLLLQRLPHLVDLEYSLVLETGVERELWHIEDTRLQSGDKALVPMVRRMYVEVGYERNFPVLSVLLRLCPKVEDLHVHFLRGNFWKAILECTAIHSECVHLQTFTFTSEVWTFSQHEWFAPLKFAACTALCANIRHNKSTNSWNCIRLHNFGLSVKERKVLPSQLVVVVVDFKENRMAEGIRLACGQHDWTQVRQLCLLLFPAELSSTTRYPTAGVEYRNSLRHLFSTALENVVELNINSFHFDSAWDLAELLENGSLTHLHSLSASPCGLRHSSLRRVARNCPDLKDLDVRVERKGCFQRCGVCDDFVADPQDSNEFSDAGAPYFSGLSRLTLAGLHGYGSFWFVKACGPTATVRLSDCSSPWDNNYGVFVQVLSKNNALVCLVLESEHLDFTKSSLLNDLCRVVSVEHLCLLSTAQLSDDTVERSAANRLHLSLRRLVCLHVHYRSLKYQGLNMRTTWIRDREAKSGQGSHIVVRSGACPQCCSTATFVGLAKPLNRPLAPTL